MDVDNRRRVTVPQRANASDVNTVGLLPGTADAGTVSVHTRPDEAPGELAWALVDAAPDGIVLTDDEGRILLINRRIEQLFGCDRGEVLGQPVQGLLSEDFGEAHRAFCARFRSQPTTAAAGGLLLSGRRRDGSDFPVEVGLSPLPTADGRLCVIAAVRDISARVAAEERVREVQRMLDATHDAVFMFDPVTLALTYVNHGAIEQLGYTRDELLTMTAADLNPTITAESCRAIVCQFGPGKSAVSTTLHRRKDGTDVTVEVLLERPPDGPHGSGWLVGVARDITERLDAERRAQDAERALAVLEERQRLSRDVHDIVGHGLTVMALQAEAARRVLDVDPEQTRDFLDAIGLIGRHAAEDLDVALAGTAAAPVDPGLGHGLANLPLLLDSMRSTGMSVDLVVTGEIQEISALVDRSAYRIVQEALTNVAKHAPGAAVSVTVCVEEHDLRLTVADEGGPVPALGASPDGRGVSGMRQRVAMLGGEIEVGRGPERGFKVSVMLPCKGA
jgi:PAS domain S-box-containing protein